MKKIYKFIPLIIIVILGAILCLNAKKWSEFSMMIHAEYLPLETKLIAISLYILLPSIVLSVFGAIGVEKIRKGKKLLFMIWIILFLVWLYWIYSLTMFIFYPIPL